MSCRYIPSCACVKKYLSCERTGLYAFSIPWPGCGREHGPKLVHDVLVGGRTERSYQPSILLYLDLAENHRKQPPEQYAVAKGVSLFSPEPAFSFLPYIGISQIPQLADVHRSALKLWRYSRRRF